MISVFSHTDKKVSEQIRDYQKCAGSNYSRILLAGPENERLYILKPELLDVLKFINQKILYELPNVKNNKNTKWIGVRIRIFVNWLDKYCQRGLIPKEVAIEYHRRLIENVGQILGMIYTEDLPF